VADRRASIWYDWDLTVTRPIAIRPTPSLPGALFALALAVAMAACNGRGQRSAAEAPLPMARHLLDHTTAGNVVTSPMIGVESTLGPLEQRFTPDDLVASSSTGRGGGWTACLPHPAVVGVEGEAPLGMQVRYGGQLVPYRGTGAGPSFDYTETRLVLQADFRRGPDDPPVTDADRVLTSAWDVVLPEGPIAVELLATRDQVLPAEHRLELQMDGEPVAAVTELDVHGRRFTITASCGEHRLTLALQQPENPSSRRDPRFLPLVRVEIGSPFGLLRIDPGAGAGAGTGDLVVHWDADPEGSGAGELAALAGRWPHPLVDEHVHGSLKQLSGERASRSVLLAPTPSELVYEVDVPARGRLRLGCGTMPSADATVDFEVRLRAGDDLVTLLEQGLAPGAEEPVGHTLDLSAWAGKRVELSLSTRSDPVGRHQPAAWIDPVLYSPVAPGEPRPPNVILLVVDTLGARHVGLHGYTRDTAPALSALADEAAVFHRARAQYPTTAVSHMSMFTSRLPHRSARALRVDFGVGGGASTEPTMAQLLRQEGWATAALTGGGAVHHTLGFDHGFDLYASHDDDDSPETMAAHAETWIRRHADQPFFLFLHTYQVHGPYAPRSPYNGAFTTSADPYVSLDPMAWLEPGEFCQPVPAEMHGGLVALYDGEILYTDEQLIGPLVDLLRELALYDDTLLIVTADHGEEFGEHGCWTHGANLHDETLHVPLVIRFPHGGHAGRELSDVVSLVDVLPTVLGTVGVDVGAAVLDGRDLARVLAGEPTDEAVALRMTSVPLPDGTGQVAVDEFTVATGTHKLIVSEHPRARLAGSGTVEPTLQLYDLVADPGERHDLAEEQPELAEQLLQRARSYYDPDVSLGEARRSASEAGGMQWKEHMRGLGYIDAVE